MVLRDLAAQSHDVFLTAVGEDVSGKPAGFFQRHLGRLEPDASLSSFSKLIRQGEVHGPTLSRQN